MNLPITSYDPRDFSPSSTGGSAAPQRGHQCLRERAALARGTGAPGRRRWLGVFSNGGGRKLEVDGIYLDFWGIEW